MRKELNDLKYHIHTKYSTCLLYTVFGVFRFEERRWDAYKLTTCFLFGRRVWRRHDDEDDVVNKNVL